jgi:ATP-dependent Clp protease ATP-binding subunit ClpC
VRKALVLIVGRGDEKPDEGTIGMTARAKRVIERADRFAGRLGTKTIGTEHLLLGILSLDDGMAARVLSTLGSDPQQVEANLWRELEAASV